MPCPPFHGPGKALLLYYSTNSVDEQSCFRRMNFCCQKRFLFFRRAQSVPPQGCTAIFDADASDFCIFTARFNSIHLKGEELTVLHLSIGQQKRRSVRRHFSFLQTQFTSAFSVRHPCPPGRGDGARQPWTAARHCGSVRGPWQQQRAGRSPRPWSTRGRCRA